MMTQSILSATDEVAPVDSRSGPDFGPNVLVFDPTQDAIQDRIDAVFREQERAQFGRGRFALLFKRGRYEVDVPVGFFTHVAGLGTSPADVTIAGRVWTDATWMGRNATCNFWRTVENLTIAPPSGSNVWAVSQAAPMRRTHVRGDLHLSSGGWSSGGFLADCLVDGAVHAGSQQQWFSRNSQWRAWEGGQWNMVFVGCVNPPVGTWPEKPFTALERTHVVREKPFLTVDDAGNWSVTVPPLVEPGSAGVSWRTASTAGEAVSLDDFHIARADRDDASTINAALRLGKHLLLTPGIYALEDSIRVSRPGTIVLGLGLPSLEPTTGKPVLVVEGPGVVISGVLADAGETEVETLVQIGIPGHCAGRREAPTFLHDVFCRVGGAGPGRARCMLTIYDDHVVGDNLWLWRADHGANVGWADNTCETGLIVEGDYVTVYGLFVEHAQAYQTVWNGNAGRVYFYQSEMPYDPPSQEAWRSPSGDGFASYKVGEHVTSHEAWGVGVYHVFKKAPTVADNAIEAPAREGIAFHHALTFRLGGGVPGSGIRSVINGTGGETIVSQKATVV